MTKRKIFIAEVFGTFCLVFAGAGAITINAVSNGAISHVGIALVFGLVVLAMVYAVGDISGAHLNPAVTLGFVLAGRLSPGSLPLYWMAQLTGAGAASFFLRLLFPASKNLGQTVPAGSAFQSFALETVLTAILMLVILSVSTGAKEKGITAGIVVGAVIALEALFAGPICGASMNPARSLMPALAAQDFRSLWVYLLAPSLGAGFGVVLCSLMREPGCCQASALCRVKS